MTDRGDNWNDIADWWADEAASDPAYEHDVHPVFDHLMSPLGGRVLDLGCGEGQAMRRQDRWIVGVDLSSELARRAASAGSAVVADLPDLSFLRPASVDGAYAVYLVDLIADHARFFAETARVVADAGHLVVIINHPVYTAPGSSPLMDDDGEVLWRWGAYFGSGWSIERGGGRDIRFHHRSMGDLLTTAAASGWIRDELVERPLSADTITRLPGYEGQEQIPRLLGVRWRKGVGAAR